MLNGHRSHRRTTRGRVAKPNGWRHCPLWGWLTWDKLLKSLKTKANVKHQAPKEGTSVSKRNASHADGKQASRSVLNTSGCVRAAMKASNHLRKTCTASALRFHHHASMCMVALTQKMKREATHEAVCGHVSGASSWHFCLTAVVISLSGVVIDLWREMLKQEKISSFFMPDFLPGASVQKRASHCAPPSVYLGRSNEKIEFLCV